MLFYVLYDLKFDPNHLKTFQGTGHCPIYCTGFLLETKYINNLELWPQSVQCHVNK